MPPSPGPPTIPPEAALLPGRRDPASLLFVWYVRKVTFPILWLGIIAALLAGRNDIDIGFHSVSSVRDRLLSPLAGIAIALILRLIVGAAALALAYPLAVGREAQMPPRHYRGAVIGLLFDRFHTARAFRALRWTHEVRQAAIARLGTAGRRVGRLDPILDVVNIALLIAIPVVMWLTAP